MVKELLQILVEDAKDDMVRCDPLHMNRLLEFKGKASAHAEVIRMLNREPFKAGVIE